uniref:MARVEL domain-containing protein n=1 Tax=Terrapene triunguis TaxID=2587831 RepID=A0A674J6D5_9SAUR
YHIGRCAGERASDSVADLFSLIIFASLVTDGYQNLTASSQLRCVLNDNRVACGYAITAGVLAFLQSFLFLAFDAYDNIIISHKVKSVILSLDLTFSIIWSCIWFVGFCFLANQWNRSAHHYLLGSSSARASIAFAFFSIPCWESLACFIPRHHPLHILPVHPSSPPLGIRPLTDHPQMGDSYFPQRAADLVTRSQEGPSHKICYGPSLSLSLMRRHQMN